MRCHFNKSGLAQGGGLVQTYHNSEELYSGGFSLALRMISVAAGVTVGLFVSQVLGRSIIIQNITIFALQHL